MKVALNPVKSNVPNFKSNITFDIGGSQREGSCKIYYASTPCDEVFFKERTTVNDLGKSKFENADDFIQLIVKKIGRIQKDNKEIVKAKGYDESENALKNVAIFVPSYTAGDRAFYFPNLKNNKDKPLQDIDFSNFKERLAENGITVSDDMNFKLLQDAIGTGLAMTLRLFNNNMLEAGKLYTACITGGGCGISNIEVVDDENVIIKSSGSSYLSQSLSMQKVSKAGASAPALVENFCKAMGLNEEIIDNIKSCHKAEFVLDPYVQYPKDVKTERLKSMLLETNIFEMDDENEFAYTIKVKDEYLPKFNTARRNAIDKYCLALARLAIIKKTEGANGMIVTGTLAQAVNRAAQSSYGSSISEWVMQHLTQSFNSYELDKIQGVYGFDVLCDKRFAIDNNAECGELVHMAKFVGPHRSNWLKLNIQDLRTCSLHDAQHALNEVKCLGKIHI